MASTYNKKLTPPTEEKSKSPDKDARDQCRKVLFVDWSAAKSRFDAAYTTVEDNLDRKQYKICCMVKISDTLREYRYMDYCVGIGAQAGADIIKKNVEGYNAKNKDLEAALKATAATIKTLKEKLAELKSSACSLETCSRDSCNADQVTILDRRRDKNEIDFDFISAVGSLKKMAEDALGLGDTAFMSVVETNGIQTFSSVGSLTGLSTAVCDKIKAFKTNLDTNVKDRSKDLEKANEEMAAAVKEHTEKQMAYHAEGANYHGLSESLNFICNSQKNENLPTIDEICKKVKVNLSNQKADIGQEKQTTYTEKSYLPKPQTTKNPLADNADQD